MSVPVTVSFIVLYLLFLLPFSGLQAQQSCDIKNKVNPDGTLFYFIEPVRFYWTQTKQLNGGVITDEENYFLLMEPRPFPPKPEGNKLKKDIAVRLSNGQSYNLEHYDSRYSENDSIFDMLFLINKSNLEDFGKYDVEQVTIEMGKEDARVYNFKLHKAAVREQLKCFMERK